MKPFGQLNKFLGKLPVNLAVILLCVFWIVPTLGLFVTSFRSSEDVRTTGWWTVFSPVKIDEYSSEETIKHAQDPFWTRLTLRNYADALVGYKGTQDYLTDCEQQNPSALMKFKCTWTDIFNPEGMGSAVLNTLAVAIPATLLPILIATFAAYAFAWMDFKGRQWIFALLVGLQIIPLQMTLVPIARLYVSLGMQGTFIGIWLFHTGFGLPYAIYLLRNFLGSLPREIFESVYLDGANHFTAFWHIVLPLTKPAIASLAIFQFLWVWNDFLVAKIFLSNKPVLTVQITNLIDPRGGNWHIMTGAAFLSFIIPMVVFFIFQKQFVRGLLAGSVKG